jgi:hypothetical protein
LLDASVDRWLFGFL